MRKIIDTLEIAERFGKAHRDVLRSVRSCLINNDYLLDALFSQKTYVNKQNKVCPMYEMGLEGFCLLTDTWSFSRGDAAFVKAEILKEFGESFAVVGSHRSRFEDDFYRMLSDCFHMEKIIRQFPISSCRVDFYFPEWGFIVEYDEEQHLSAKAKRADAEREETIRRYMREEFSDTIDIIRVKKGEEFRGLSAIAGQMALCSNNATAITKYRQSKAVFTRRHESAAALQRDLSTGKRAR